MPQELLNDLTCCQMTEDLRFSEIRGKFQEMSEMLGNVEEVLSRYPKRKILTIVLQNCKKSSVKRFIQKPMSLDFVDLWIYVQ